MELEAIDQAMLRFFEASTVGEAEDALGALAAIDADDPAAAEEHEPIGDLFSELAMDCAEAGEQADAVRLQTAALEHPCTNRWREIGTLLGYRFASGERDAALADLRQLSAGPPDGAYLLSAFAEVIEPVDGALALGFHDEALAIARSGKDDDVLGSVQAPRALLREELGHAPDADDEAGFVVLEELRAEIAAAEAAEAHQLYVPREELGAAAAQWPELAATLGWDDPDAYYRALDLEWRAQPATGHSLVLEPIDVAMFAAAGAEPERLVADLPDDLQESVEARGAEQAWPPGRNEPCWCGSGRKYKRCCGAG